MKRMWIPTDERGVKDYNNLRETRSEANNIDDGKPVRAYVITDKERAQLIAGTHAVQRRRLQ